MVFKGNVGILLLQPLRDTTSTNIGILLLQTLGKKGFDLDETFSLVTMLKGMHNGVTSAFSYSCHVWFLLSWRRANDEWDGCLPLAKGWFLKK